MRPIIQAENLSKVYRIGVREAAYATLRDALVGTLRRRRQTQRSPQRAGGETLWALRDVGFEVRPGEVVGIIGRNGAGKSTLLKILSRIVEPTTGGVRLYGRVGSLLEVGTGFHPELTGRENIYLNGAILGMKRAEIAAKFDEIVAFAEVEKFIDTPVKHYSSGMYMRLAFAVAAHLEPEILIVDEVLAVGDAAFQKKCLGKMDNIARQGRTVLFVSHNMMVISKLCQTVMAMDGGRLVNFGAARPVIAEYMHTADAASGERQWQELDTAPGDEYLRIRQVSTLDAERRPLAAIAQDAAFVIRVVYEVLKPMSGAHVRIRLKTEEGTMVFESFDADNPAWTEAGRQPGVYVADCLIPARWLNEGRYYVSLRAGIPFIKLSLDVEEVMKFEITPPVTTDGSLGRLGIRRAGVLAPDLEWQIHRR